MLKMELGLEFLLAYIPASFLHMLCILRAMDIRDQRRIWVIGFILAVFNLAARQFLPRTFGPLYMLAFFLLAAIGISLLYSVSFYKSAIGAAFVLFLSMLSTVLFYQVPTTILKITIDQLGQLSWWQRVILSYLELIVGFIYYVLGSRFNLSVVKVTAIDEKQDE